MKLFHEFAKMITEEKKTRKAAIVVARCLKCGETFGIRLEQKEEKLWNCTWAFKISEAAAMREGYEKTEIIGNTITDSEYPGCPYCGAMHWCVCPCGKANCLIGTEDEVTCAWCNTTRKVRQGVEIHISGGAY